MLQGRIQRSSMQPHYRFTLEAPLVRAVVFSVSVATSDSVTSMFAARTFGA